MKDETTSASFNAQIQTQRFNTNGTLQIRREEIVEVEKIERNQSFDLLNDIYPDSRDSTANKQTVISLYRLKTNGRILSRDVTSNRSASDGVQISLVSKSKGKTSSVPSVPWANILSRRYQLISKQTQSSSCALPRPPGCNLRSRMAKVTCKNAPRVYSFSIFFLCSRPCVSRVAKVKSIFHLIILPIAHHHHHNHYPITSTAL